MSDDFDEKFAELRRIVGKGTVKGTIEVDQLYARWADGTGDLGDDTGVITPTQIAMGPKGKPGPEFDHPRGGRSGYLTDTLTTEGPRIAQSWADAIGNRQPLDTVFIRNVEDISAIVAVDAPREFWLLRGSAHPSVEREGSTVYDRPAFVPRMPDSMLQAMKLGKEQDILHANQEARRPSDLTPPQVGTMGGGVA